jgi:hypothetical protein
MPETPAPSSRIVEEGVRRWCVERKFWGEEIQFAKRGVTVHTTEEVVSFMVRL